MSGHLSLVQVLMQVWAQAWLSPAPMRASKRALMGPSKQLSTLLSMLLLASASLPALGADETAPASATATTTGSASHDRARIDVIAHRGASGYLPEHTLAAYAYAYAQGADLIEPDLVMTRDGVLVVRHEPRLDETTDVAERFPQRRAADGAWYAADLDWDEVATLRAREYRRGRFPATSAVLPVPRFTDVIALVAGLNAVTGCRVGIYPELKETAWHRARGLDPVPALRAALADARFDGEVRIQSFEPPPLIELAAEPIAGTRLIQLVGDPTMVTPAGLAGIAEYADGVGPAMVHLARARAAGDDVVGRAHALGLQVDTWTLRADAPEPFPNLEAATALLLDMGVDGIFTDHPDRLLAALGRQTENRGTCTTR